MPVEPLFLVSGGLVLAALAAALVRGRIRRPVRPDPEQPVSPDVTRWPSADAATRASVTLIGSTPPREGAQVPFPGVVGTRRLANEPPPIISIPTSSMSPAARDRARQSGAPPPGPAQPPPSSMRPTYRRARRLGMAASLVAGALVAAVLFGTSMSSPRDAATGPLPVDRAAMGDTRTPNGLALGPRAPAVPPAGGAAEGSPAPRRGAPTGRGTTVLSSAPEPARGGGRSGRDPRATDPPGGGATDMPGPTPAPDRTPAPTQPTPAPATDPPPTSTPAPETTPTPAPLSVNFTVRVANLTVRLTNHSRGTGTCTWDFGDGATSKDRNPSHTYGAAGTYIIALTCTGAAGGSASRREEVTVGA
jgi:hypothetical protein